MFAFHLGLQFYDDSNRKRMRQEPSDWRDIVLNNKYMPISKALDAQSSDLLFVYQNIILFIFLQNNFKQDDFNSKIH